MKASNMMVLAVLGLTFATAYAQSDEKVLNSAPINVDGYLHEEKPATDGELEQIKHEIKKQKTEVHLNKEKTKGFKELSKTTEKLSESTEEYLDEKEEAQKEIAEYNKKIKCLMEKNLGPECEKYRRGGQVTQEVSTGQAAAAPAPVVTSTVEAPVATGAPFEVIKLIPFAGGTAYNGDREQVEAEIAGGLRLESNISKRLSMGIGLNYASLKTEDYANNMFNGMYGGMGGMSGMGGGYYGAYGAQGREIRYKSMGLDLYTKFFITQGERFRPYVGAGLGYNRSSMNYTQNNPYSYTQAGYGYAFGNEEFKTSYATGTVMAGTEIMVTNRVGINLEGAYATGLGDGFQSEAAKSPLNSPDQRRLQQLSKELIKSNQLSIFAGAVIVF